MNGRAAPMHRLVYIHARSIQYHVLIDQREVMGAKLRLLKFSLYNLDYFSFKKIS